MIIWFLILVPIITIIVLLFNYSRKITWWEYLIHFGVALLLIVIMKVIGEGSQTRDTEYWGDLVQRAEYYEFYSIWDHETCTRQVPCGTDSDGNTKYCTETYDCSHLDSYPAHWKIVTASGWTMSISKSFYDDLVKKFGTKVNFQDMHRDKECGFGDYVVEDGDMYYVTWDGSPEKSQSVFKSKKYKNKVQCSRSVFNYEDIKKEEAKELGLYDYPNILSNYELKSILGLDSLNDFDLAEKKFQYLNGDLGPKKELRVWVLIFKDKTIDIAKLQEAYWKGGNKNEFVVTIGLDGQGNVSWCHPFSWTEVSELKIITRNYVMEQKVLNLENLADYLYKELDGKWIRKQFRDFSYLTVDPPLWALIVAFVLQIMFNVGYSIWAVRNDHEAE